MHARSILLLVPALCLGCGLLPVTAPNNQTEWTTSGGPDESSAAQLSASSGDEADGPPATQHASGPRVVSLPDGTTTLGIPLGTGDGPGPVLVEPVSGGPPELGTPLD